MNLDQRISACSTIAKTISRNLMGIKFEPEVSVLHHFVGRGSIAMDIGAANGRYALRLSQLVGPDGLVYCFEPGEHNQMVFSAIQKFYRMTNTILVKKALLDHEGTVTFALPIKKKKGILQGLGYSTAHVATEDDQESSCVKSTVEATTVDRFVSMLHLPKLDFIKCDVEGAELQVFKGARQTLERMRPTVLCEIYKAWLHRSQTTPEELQSFFAGLNYKTYQLKDGKLIQIQSIEEDNNYFFIHSDVNTPNWD